MEICIVKIHFAKGQARKSWEIPPQIPDLSGEKVGARLIAPDDSIPD